MEIQSWADADEVLGEVRRLDAEAREVEARRDAELARVAGPFEARLNRLAEARAKLVAALEAFATARRKSDFGTAKSRQLDNGRIGWRARPPRVALLSPQKHWANVVAKVLDAGARFRHWIRRQPVLAKDAILVDVRAGKVDGDTLRQFDLRIAGGDEVFYVKPTAEPIRDREEE